MTTYERRTYLLDLLRRQPGSRVPEIAVSLSVSEGTVRNDLNALEAEGLLERVHGGAVLTERKRGNNVPFSDRHSARVAEKECMAKIAANLIQDGDSIFLDASSTIHYLGLALAEKHDLRVVTNGLDVARVLAKDLTNAVFLIGGVLTADGSSTTGSFGEEMLQNLRAQKAFVSGSGFSIERGMTELHMVEANIKRRMVESATSVYALIDSEKIGHEDLTPFIPSRDLTAIITDDGVTKEWQQKIHEIGVQIMIADGTVS